MPPELDDDLLLDPDGPPIIPTPQDAKPDEIEIQYVDGPDAEKQYQTNTVNEQQTKWTSEDKKKYGKNVRNRIGQMDYRVHQAERERDQAMRERQAIEEHARSLAQQIEELKSRERELGSVAYDATKMRVDNEVSATKNEIARILEDPQPDARKLVDAQERLSQLVAQRAQVAQMSPPKPTSQQANNNGHMAQMAQQPGQMQQPLVAPTYQSDRERWLAINPWFGKDLERTKRIVAIEQRLVNDGVIMGSKAYWNAIEGAKRQLDQNGAPAPMGQTRSVVSGSTGRSAPGTSPASTGNRRVVQLTEDERRAAKRLNVSEEEWATEKDKRERKLRAQQQ